MISTFGGISPFSRPHFVPGGGGDPLAGISFAIRLQASKGFGPTPDAPFSLYQDTSATIPAVNDGDLIAAWVDELGTSGLKATQSNSAFQPVLRIISGIPVVVGSVGTYMDLPNILTGNDSDVFIVAQNDGGNVGTSYNTVLSLNNQFGIYSRMHGTDQWGIYQGSNVDSGQPGTAYASWNITRNGTTSLLRTNGGSSVSDSFASIPYVCRIGWDGSPVQYHSGPIVAVAVSDSVLSGGDNADCVTFFPTLAP